MNTTKPRFVRGFVVPNSGDRDSGKPRITPETGTPGNQIITNPTPKTGTPENPEFYTNH